MGGTHSGGSCADSYSPNLEEVVSSHPDNWSLKERPKGPGPTNLSHTFGNQLFLPPQMGVGKRISQFPTKKTRKPHEDKDAAHLDMAPVEYPHRWERSPEVSLEMWRPSHLSTLLWNPQGVFQDPAMLVDKSLLFGP